MLWAREEVVFGRKRGRSIPFIKGKKGMGHEDHSTHRLENREGGEGGKDLDRITQGFVWRSQTYWEERKEGQCLLWSEKGVYISHVDEGRRGGSRGWGGKGRKRPRSSTSLGIGNNISVVVEGEGFVRRGDSGKRKGGDAYWPL